MVSKQVNHVFVYLAQNKKLEPDEEYKKEI